MTLYINFTYIAASNTARNYFRN